MQWAGACAPAHILRKAESPMGSRVSARAVPGITPAGPEPKDLDTKFTAIAAVKHVDVVTIQLKSSLDDVTTVSQDEHIVKSGHGGREFFRNTGGAKVGERPSVNVCDRTPTEEKFWKASLSVGIAMFC